MKIEFVAIGDEIINGKTKETNGAWLSEFLKRNGMELARISIVRDDEQEIHLALKKAMENSNIIVTTGGLGPTKDDITKKVLADFFHFPLVDSKLARDIATKNYDRMGRVWDPTTSNYNLVPELFTPVNNPVGAAPGLIYDNRDTDKLLLIAPGVPSEFYAMFEKEFLPYITNNISVDRKYFHQVVIRTKGIPESKIFTELCPTLWEELEKFGKVSSLPQLLGVDIVVQFRNDFGAEEKIKEEIFDLIKKTPIKESVWQYDNLSLPELIVQKARQAKLKIGFAESCTGGLTASLITDVSGSSDVFNGSVVSYSNGVKSSILNVDDKTLKKFGAVSTETALEMAIGAKQALDVDIAISFTGIAGPDGGTEEKPVGTVAIGWASKNHTDSKMFNFNGDRNKLKHQFARFGLFILLDIIDRDLL